MSTFHEQAMRLVYQQVLHRLLGFFNRHERIALQLLIQRLLVAGGGADRIGHFRIMVIHEGGKESAYALAFLRAAQLSIAARTPATFTLRVSVLRQPRMTPSVMARIQHQCNELFLYDDRRVEVVHSDEQGVQAIDRHTSFPEKHVGSDRIKVLMSGHLSQGDARATFLYTDLLSRAKLFRNACQWGEPVDALIDRRPPLHLGQYTRWILSVAKHLGYPSPGMSSDPFEHAVNLCLTLDEAYKSLLCPASRVQCASVSSGGHGIGIINVFDCLSHEADVLNSEVLLFTEGQLHANQLDVDEPQIAVILLAAHLQGVRQEIQKQDYCNAVSNYLHRALLENESNLRYKGQLIRHMSNVFNTPNKIQPLRVLISQYLDDLHGLTDTHLGCVIHSPFIEQGAGLTLFLEQCYPEKLPQTDEIHDVLLAGRPVSSPHVSWLETISGLPLQCLQALYAVQKIDVNERRSIVDVMQFHDPHKSAG